MNTEKLLKLTQLSCLYVLSSMLWCLLRFRYRNDVRFIFTSSCLSNTYCVVCLFCFSSSCIPCVASFSKLSIFDCPFGILKYLLNHATFYRLFHSKKVKAHVHVCYRYRFYLCLYDFQLRIWNCSDNVVFLFLFPFLYFLFMLRSFLGLLQDKPLHLRTSNMVHQVYRNWQYFTT